MNHESFHQSDPSREIIESQRAMARLGSDFDRHRAYYWGMAKALNLYLRDEYGLELSDARLYIQGLERDGVLPSKDEFSIGDPLLADSYRNAVYRHLVPLYRELHSADEFEAWLPAAIDVVFPPDDPHATGDCRPMVRDDAADAGGLSCMHSDICRRRMVVADVLRGGAFLAPAWQNHSGVDESLRSLDTSLADPWRAYDDSICLVRSLTDRGIFDEDGALIAEMRLQEVMHDRFGIAVSDWTE